ncbi:MAG: alpha/beta fold hydrolase [Pseudomonadales bacterium]
MIAIILGLLLIGGVLVFEGDMPAGEVDARYASYASAFLARPDGGRVHYRDEGRRDGYPLVLLHGSNASLHTWEPWVALLGDEYRIVTLDLPGHGLTGRVPDDDYSTAAYIDTVVAVADHLGLEQFALGGNSMGGGVTWQFALAHPERVGAMLLVNATGLWSWREAGPPRGSGTPMAFRLLGQDWFRGIARHLDSRYLVAQGLRASFHDPELVDDAMVRRYYELSMREGARAATLIRFGSFRGVAAAAEPDLSVLSQPTLILWGEHDALIPPEVGERFVETLPDARLIVYPDAGHIPMEEVPERSADDVRAFLGVVLGRTAS